MHHYYGVNLCCFCAIIHVVNNAKVMGLTPVWDIHLRVRLNYRCGSLPTQNTLWLRESLARSFAMIVHPGGGIVLPKMWSRNVFNWLPPKKKIQPEKYRSKSAMKNCRANIACPLVKSCQNLFSRNLEKKETDSGLKVWYHFRKLP